MYLVTLPRYNNAALEKTRSRDQKDLRESLGPNWLLSCDVCGFCGPVRSLSSFNENLRSNFLTINYPH